MISYFKILRPINIFILTICFHLTNLILNENFLNHLSILLVICILAGFANTLNDIIDHKIDLANNIKRPITQNKISIRSAKMFAILLFLLCLIITYFSSFSSLTNFLIFSICFPLIIMYTPIFKKIPLVGNIVVSFLISMTFIIFSVSISGFIPALMMPIIIFSFLITLIREIVKDIQDFNGDELYHINSLPVKYGIKYSINIILVISIVLLCFSIGFFFLFEKYDVIYLSMILLLVHFPLFYHLIKLYKNKSSTYCIYLSKVLKLITVFGVIVIYLITI